MKRVMHPRTAGAVMLLLAACERDPSLTRAETVTPRDAANPTVAVDPRSGAVYVAWVQKSGDRQWDVYLARKAADSAFGAAVRVNDRPGEVTVERENPPQVVVGADGVVHVGWISDRTGSDPAVSDISIRLARSADGGKTFSASATLDVDPWVRSLANMYYDLAAAADGSLYVSWLDLRHYTDSLAAHRARGLPGSIPVPENRVDVRIARSSDSGRTFEGQAVLDSTACLCCRTAIATGGDGSLHALWRHVFAGNVRDITTARSTDAAESFGPATRVHEDGWVLNGCPDIGPDVAVDPAGVVHAAWYTGAPGRVGLWYASSLDSGRTFGEPARLLPAGPVPPSRVQLVAAREYLWAAWEDRRAARPVVRFGTPGRSRGTVVGEGDSPGIAAAGGVLAVVWLSDGAVLARVAEVTATSD